MLTEIFTLNALTMLPWMIALAAAILLISYLFMFASIASLIIRALTTAISIIVWPITSFIGFLANAMEGTCGSYEF